MIFRGRKTERSGDQAETRGFRRRRSDAVSRPDPDRRASAAESVTRSSVLMEANRDSRRPRRRAPHPRASPSRRDPCRRGGRRAPRLRRPRMTGALPDGPLPPIAPADLTPGLLRAGILRDGAVLVRGVVDAGGARRLWPTGSSRPSPIAVAVNARQPAADSLYEEFEPQPGFAQLTERNWIEAGGGVLAADSPRLMLRDARRLRAGRPRQRHRELPRRAGRRLGREVHPAQGRPLDRRRLAPGRQLHGRRPGAQRLALALALRRRRAGPRHRPEAGRPPRRGRHRRRTRSPT